MIAVPPSEYNTIAELIGDTPFTVTPCFFIQRRACDLFTLAERPPRAVVIIPSIPSSDVYVISLEPALAPADVECLADLLAGLTLPRGLFVPGALVQAVRARRQVAVEAEGLCFTCGALADGVAVSRPERTRRLNGDDAPALAGLPHQAGFLTDNYGSPTALLAEGAGTAVGVFHGERLVSVAVSLALTAGHCDVGVYTVPRYRHLGYATDCVQALFAAAAERGIRPLWRVGIRQKIAIRLAEKLGLTEIGEDGREVYLQLRASR